MAKETLFQRIVVDAKTGCWLWQGSLDRYGYARESRHRRVYEARKKSARAGGVS